MKIYISGKITGCPGFYERFKEAESLIRSLGHTPINPAAVNARLPEDTEYEQYMKMSFVMLDMADAIYMMPGWNDSKGASLEIARARENGIFIMDGEEQLRAVLNDPIIESEKPDMFDSIQNKDGPFSEKDRTTVFARCISTYGPKPQIDMTIEESAELIKALSKWKRAKWSELTTVRDNIVDELADVRIMIRQMEILFKCEDEVESRIDFKVKRQIERLEQRKK
jgi:hypothetical protein